ncbi:MAG: deoxynucleoside kinase [Myxococcota bacterium]
MYRYIAIEGAIGVGKTELARLLANRLQAKLILEDVVANPFIEKFYKDRRRYAFSAQIFFLFARYAQQQELAQQELFQAAIVSDYLFAKDRIFASINLSEDEQRLYDQIYKLLDIRITKPDLVVHLQAKPEALLERIKKRRREFERPITLDYLKELNDAYNKFFFLYSESPLLVVNTDEIDFVENQSHREQLIEEILKIHRGTKHYIPRP